MWVAASLLRQLRQRCHLSFLPWSLGWTWLYSNTLVLHCMAWLVVRKVTHHHRVRHLHQWGAGRLVHRVLKKLWMGFARCDLLCSQSLRAATPMSSTSASSPSCCIERGNIRDRELCNWWLHCWHRVVGRVVLGWVVNAANCCCMACWLALSWLIAAATDAEVSEVVVYVSWLWVVKQLGSVHRGVGLEMGLRWIGFKVNTWQFAEPQSDLVRCYKRDFKAHVGQVKVKNQWPYGESAALWRYFGRHP